MGRGRFTVRQLADAAGLDVDEVLIHLWDRGLEAYAEPDDSIRSEDVNAARRAIGLPTVGELRRPAYWQRVLELSAEELETLMADAGIRMSPRARLLPRGAVARLKRVARERRFRETPPVTIEEPARQDAPPVEWHTIGRERELRLLTEDEVRQIHVALVTDFARDNDPIEPPGVRDENLLGSAVFRQHTTFGDEAKYKSVEMAAAALLHSLVHDHPFHNGNKRTGLVSMIVLLDENGLILTCNEEVLFRFILRVAQHQLVPKTWDSLADREVMSIAEWVHNNSRGLEKGERPVPWRRLKQILSSLGCEYELTTGSRMNITRSVVERGRLGLRTRRTLRAQVKYTDDGREALKHTVHEIRARLELDEEHGTDSARFYGEAPALDEFIIRYRKTLKRLARL